MVSMRRFNLCEKSTESKLSESKPNLVTVNEPRPKKRTRKIHVKRQRLLMNVFNCRYEVVRDVAKEYFMMRMIEEEHPVSVLPGQT